MLKRLTMGLVALVVFAGSVQAEEISRRWKRDWPMTDFEKSSAAFEEFKSGGPRKDEIPAISRPDFRSVLKSESASTEPVISVEINGDARAYPISILMWHEVVNDTVGGEPISITYCPLCNSGIVFDRIVNGQETTFGTSGMLRNSDMVMYDRLTESWWQQFTGEALVGQMTGAKLDKRPARIEALGKFAERHEDGKLLVPNNSAFRPYGNNPYPNYDRAKTPMLYRGDYKGPVPPLMRVVAVGKEAWALDHLRRHGEIQKGDLKLSWVEGQNSPLHKRYIAEGRDIGNVVVQRREGEEWIDTVYDVPFAFAFMAFVPDGQIYYGVE